MAETFINVTEGSGKKLHTFDRTIGANSVHDEFVLMGEQPMADYRCTTGTTYASAATADSHLVQIMAGASLNVYVRRIRVYQHGVATTVTAASAQIVRLTSAGTGGTAFTAAPMDLSDSASGATVMTLPTVKGAEGPSLDQAEGIFIQTLAAGTFPNQTFVFDFDFRGSRQKSLRIGAGVALGIAVKLRTAVAAATVAIAVEFSEANF